MECKGGGVAGGDGGSVGEENVDGGIGWSAIGVWRVDVNVVTSTAAVDDTLGEGGGNKVG